MFQGYEGVMGGYQQGSRKEQIWLKRRKTDLERKVSSHALPLRIDENRASGEEIRREF